MTIMKQCIMKGCKARTDFDALWRLTLLTAHHLVVAPQLPVGGTAQHIGHRTRGDG